MKKVERIGIIIYIIIIDPRFSELSGKLNHERFMQSYSFLNDVVVLNYQIYNLGWRVKWFATAIKDNKR